MYMMVKPVYLYVTCLIIEIKVSVYEKYRFSFYCYRDLFFLRKKEREYYIYFCFFTTIGSENHSNKES